MVYIFIVQLLVWIMNIYNTVNTYNIVTYTCICCAFVVLYNELYKMRGTYIYCTHTSESANVKEQKSQRRN